MDLSKDYKQIMNSIDGLVILDKDARIVFATDDVAKEEGYECGDDIAGMSIRELIPTNTAYKVLETGKKQYGEVYMVEGLTLICNSFPIVKDGEIIGAIEYDVFGDTTTLHHFLDQIAELSSELRYYKQEIKNIRGAKYSIENIMGKSKVTKELKAQIAFAARSNSTVMICGDSGVGKELVAHSIHKLSTRSLRNFIRVNCAAIPSELFESEFFGYEEGSFTGAQKGGKKGLVEMADGGTLFLDEISQLQLMMQAKLLRFLQEKEIVRIGGNTSIPVDVRIIAATNENLWELVQQKKFREDLYYRLNVVEIQVAPLREHKEDIPYIANSVIESLNESLGRVGPSHHVLGIEPDALELLLQYDWPGNVRELTNILERAMNKCYGKYITVKNLEGFLLANPVNVRESEVSGRKTLAEAKRNLETNMILSALKQWKGNRTRAAKDLGISRQMLNKKIKQYEIEE